MQLDFKGKVALITGGSSGIGKSISVSIAKAGADVVICGRNKDALNNIRKELSLINITPVIYSLDGTNSREVSKLFSSLIKKIGKLDILINNIGGVEKFGNFFELTEDDWFKSFKLNLMTMVYFCKEAIPWLKKSHSGRIINISAVPARQPGLFNPHYSAAKAAMLNLSKHLANILAKDNILVNSICPSTLAGGGWVRNIKNKADRLKISLSEAEDLMSKEEQKKVPLGRIGNIEDVANLVIFLASSQANFITGTCIDVDGGVVKSIF